MTQPNARKIEERLSSEPVEAPKGLAERIKAEIPGRPRVVDWPARLAGTSPSGTRRWAIAATIAVALIGTGLTVRLTNEVALPAIESSDGERRTRQNPPIVTSEPPPTPLVINDPAEQSPGGEVALRVGTREEAALPSEVRDPFDQAASSIQRELEALGYTEETRDAAPEARMQDAVAAAPRAPSSEGDALVEPLQRIGEDKKLPPTRPRAFALSDSVARPADVGRHYPRSQAPERWRQGVPPSTGGTTEPNDQPYGDMFYKSWGVNPFIDTEDDNLSTFGLDVDTGSYTLARSYLERGHLPPAEAVRVEEFINYFDYGDRAPARGDFAIHAETAPSPFAEGPRYQLLRFNVHGREIAARDRLPATLIFVVDVSGSMSREDRLTLVKRSLSLLLDQLRHDDRVGLVIYGSTGRVLLEPTGNLEEIRRAIDRLQPGGSTNAEEGLLLGYEMAERYYRRGALHRIILCSDGVANVGRTGPESILNRIGAATARGIELTTVGFGMGNYNDVLMEQLADQGDGSYAYVDDLGEARRIFVENLTGTLQTIAAETKVQVEFNPDAVARYRLLGYENRDIADERFRDDTVDAGEIGAGHSVTALYEIKLREDVRDRALLATLHLRYESKARGRIFEVAESIRLADGYRSWESASRALRLTSLVAEFAEILRESYWAREGDLVDVLTRAQRLSVEFAGDDQVEDFVWLVGRAARLESGAWRE